MSSTETASSGFPFRSSPTQQYFQAIEAAFIALRGAPLLLAPDDWQVAREWHREGIPLRLVEQVLGEIFEKVRRKEGESGKRKLVTLRYCRRAMNRAWRDRRELTAPATVGESQAFDPRARLTALAGALPETLAERDELTAGVLGLEGGAEEIEDQLAKLDGRALELAERSLDPSQRQDLEAQVEESIVPLRQRLPAPAVARAEQLLRQQIVRRMAGLPVLSLFSPEAEG